MTTSLETLAEKLNGKLWTKGDLKRIYLDEGHNTKKMSTKTFVWQDDNGEFRVSCRIECPSQAYQWINSQEEEVKQNVHAKIEEALATEVFVIKNTVTGEYEGYGDKLLNNADVYYSKQKAEAAINDILSKYNYTDYSVETLDRNEFDIEVKRLDEAERTANAAKQQAAPAPVVNAIPAKKPTLTIENTETPEFGVGSKVKHARFGEGTIIVESDKMVEVEFTSDGKKQLLKQFAKLERI